MHNGSVSSQSDSSPSRRSPKRKSPYLRQDVSSTDLFVDHILSTNFTFVAQMVNHVYEEFTLDEFVMQKQHEIGCKGYEMAETVASGIEKFPSAKAILMPYADLSKVYSCFETGEQARQYAESIVPVLEEEDHSLPTTRNQKRALVSVLTRAFKSTARATDNEKELTRFRKQAHDMRLVEAICWELLEACIKRSTIGPLSAQYAADRVGSTRVPMSFTERFDAIVKTMAMYKGCCNNLFKPKYHDEFVDNPYFHLNRSFSNKITNSKRAKEIEAGKAALSPRKEGTDLEDGGSPLRSLESQFDKCIDGGETVTAQLDDMVLDYSLEDPFI